MRRREGDDKASRKEKEKLGDRCHPQVFKSHNLLHIHSLSLILVVVLDDLIDIWISVLIFPNPDLTDKY